MADMVHSEVVQNHDVPVNLFELTRNVPCDVVVNLSKVLGSCLSRRLRTVYIFLLTDT